MRRSNSKLMEPVPAEVEALVQQFNELTPGVPTSALKEILPYFWKGNLWSVTSDNAEVEIMGTASYKRKRGGGTELEWRKICFHVTIFPGAPNPNGYRNRWSRYNGSIDSEEDTDGFLKHMLECRRILQLVRNGGLCDCGKALKLHGSSKCTRCAMAAFFA